jgi:murein L,D-transpeptidase YcbB/YkuD
MVFAMLKLILSILFIICSQSVHLSSGWAVNALPDRLSNRLRERIVAESLKEHFICRTELVCGIAVIPSFYEKRAYKLAWCGEEGIFPRAESLIEAIRESAHDGLRPSDYHLINLEALSKEIRQKESESEPLDVELLVDFELLLTDAFLLLASHLLAGRVNPETLHSEWVVFNPTTDLAAILQSAIETNQIKAVLKTLLSPQPGYRALREALGRYRTISQQGGWPMVPDNISWRKGDYGVRFYLLRKRLELSGDLDAAKSGYTYLFDDALEKAVRKFQKRHGLKADGVVGDKTTAALNVPVADRVRQIELNLERWRWIPHELGQEYILVNIADFKLSVVEDRQTLMEMRVVVGRDYRKTPVFSKKMKYIVLNPYWNIPQKIAVEDILPKVKQNLRYLSRQKIKVFKSWRKGAPEVNPKTIDWRWLNEENFSFKLRKEPGPKNDLGQIKFMFPNKFAVYLHDTPDRRLFKRSMRGFSSGCIRVEKAMDLATYILRDDPDWSRQKILESLKTSERRVVRLRNPIPVHLLYLTAWVDEDGLLHFRDDIYVRDEPLDVALKERPPRA